MPINEARAILPQLRTEGRVARGFMGAVLTDVDPDLQRSLRLTSIHGALVQDVTSGSPGHRAGLRAYDLITGIDDKRITTNNEIIREVARRGPGTLARLQVRARWPATNSHRAARRTAEPPAGAARPKKAIRRFARRATP